MNRMVKSIFGTGAGVKGLVFALGIGLWLAVAAPLYAAVVVEPNSPPKVIGQCGRGTLLEISGQRVLLVAGTPYEMGYQQGYLLKDQVRQLVRTVLLIARAAGERFDNAGFPGGIENAWQRTRPFIDQRYLDEIEGLADGAGIPLQDAQLANIFPELFHCSGFSLFGKATQGGRMLHGRILDYMTEAGLQDLAVVTVAKPDSFHAFVTVGYAGFLGSVTGMNQRQIVVGEMGGRGEGKWDGMPMTFLVRKVLEEADTLDQAVSLFRDTPRTCEYYYVVSDSKIPDACGLACTPDLFEVIQPGQSHPQLPHAIEDAVLMSAGSRYEKLSQFVQEDFGQITVNRALDLMNEPVAMSSCLHRVLFAPAEFLLWVSNAASTDQENYSAAFQPYYPYNFQTLLAMIPAQPADSAAKIPPRAESKAAAPTEPAKPTATEGQVPADLIRDLPDSPDPRANELLKLYRRPQQAFAYQMKGGKTFGLYSVHQVSFPSPLPGEVSANNTIHCEYYQCGGDSVRPAVILLDVLDGSMMAPRLIANSLASQGVHACIMYLPHYGPRQGQKGELEKMTEDPQVLIQSVEQAVLDIRQTARWLAGQNNVDDARLGICGVSLGGFIAALAAGVDTGFSKAAIVMAGGDLATVLMTDAREVHLIKQRLAEMGIDREKLVAMIEPIEPLTFADRLRKTDLLMVSGSTDTIVPPDCARQLAAAAGAEIKWFPADHYGMLKHLLQILTHTNNHFAAANWKTPD